MVEARVGRRRAGRRARSRCLRDAGARSWRRTAAVRGGTGAFGFRRCPGRSRRHGPRPVARSRGSGPPTAGRRSAPARRCGRGCGAAWRACRPRWQGRGVRRLRRLGTRARTAAPVPAGAAVTARPDAARRSAGGGSSRRGAGSPRLLGRRRGPPGLPGLPGVLGLLGAGGRRGRRHHLSGCSAVHVIPPDHFPCSPCPRCFLGSPFSGRRPPARSPHPPSPGSSRRAAFRPPS